MKNLFIALLICLISTTVFASEPNIILFGLPGAGKGTLSQQLTEKSHYQHICPGNLLRHEVREETEFGKAIKPIMEKGDYVAEETLFAFLKPKIISSYNSGSPLIFDGYPRSLGAFKLLDSLLKDLNAKHNTVIVHLKIDKEKLLARVLNRAVCNKCNKVYSTKVNHCHACGTRLAKRPQDTVEILQKRIAHYEHIAVPLVNSFKQHGYQVIEVDADDNAQSIFNHTYQLISKVGTNKKHTVLSLK